MSESRNTLYCSFCGKSQDEIRKLIAGPTVFICDECVLLCMDLVAESLIPERSAVELVTACPPGEMKAY